DRGAHRCDISRVHDCRSSEAFQSGTQRSGRGDGRATLVEAARPISRHYSVCVSLGGHCQRVDSQLSIQHHRLTDGQPKLDTVDITMEKTTDLDEAKLLGYFETIRSVFLTK